MKILIMSITILFFSTLYLFAQTVNEIPMQDKDPALAFVYSAFVPGLGQIYNEDIDFGFTLLGFSTVGAIFFLTDFVDAEIGVMGAYLYAMCAIYSLIEAPIRSVNINQENRMKRAALIKNYGLKDLGFNKGITIGYSFSL